MEALFQDVKAISFGKVATFKLPPDPGRWINEILKHFHEKYPWAGKYITSVDLKEKKPEEGYGLGWVEVSASTDGEASSVKIPILIKDNELYPMDVIIDRKQRFFPMTPKRLDEALFRPDLFERLVDSEDLKGKGSVGPFGFEDRYPPARQGYYGSGIFKQSSLLEAIKHTLIKDDLSKVAKIIAEDPELNKCALNNDAYYKCLEVLSNVEKTAKKASLNYEDEITPTVMQVVRMPRARYLLKTANPRAYCPTEKTLDRPTALAKLGDHIVTVADQLGRITFTTDSVLTKNAEEPSPENAADPGEYKVFTITGSPLTGIVFPSLVNTSGDEVPVRLFSAHGNGYSMQDEIAGEKVRGLTPKDIPSSPPKGFGVMFWQSNGKLKATEPLFITATGTDESTPVLEAHTAMGESARLIRAPVKDPTPADGGLMIPQAAQFHALSGKAIPLSGSADVAKNAGLRTRNRRVHISSHGHGRFSFRGGCGLDKLAKSETTNLDYDNALFLATAIGMSPEFAETKLAAAMRYSDGTNTSGLHTIVTIDEFEKKAENKLNRHKDSLASFMSSLRQDLVKEAVILEDQETIDKVLALNFLNPDNIKVFVEYLPSLEEAQQRLNRLLLGARLGLDEMDESALMNAISGLEKTIQGLKILLHTQPDEMPA